MIRSITIRNYVLNASSIFDLLIISRIVIEKEYIPLFTFRTFIEVNLKLGTYFIITIGNFVALKNNMKMLRREKLREVSRLACAAKLGQFENLRR